VNTAPEFHGVNLDLGSSLMTDECFGIRRKSLFLSVHDEVSSLWTNRLPEISVLTHAR
jgi:hypothetical protein